MLQLQPYAPPRTSGLCCTHARQKCSVPNAFAPVHPLPRPPDPLRDALHSFVGLRANTVPFPTRSALLDGAVLRRDDDCVRRVEYERNRTGKICACTEISVVYAAKLAHTLITVSKLTDRYADHCLLPIPPPQCPLWQAFRTIVS